MIVIEITPGPRFVPIVSQTPAGGYVAGVALAIIVARQFTTADSGYARVRTGATV